MTVTPITIGINQSDDHRLVFTIVDQDGNAVPYDDCTDIIFVITPSIGEPAVLTKTKSDGDITKSGANEFFTDLLYTETKDLLPGSMYCEVRIYISGQRQTVGGGALTITDTNIGDYET